MIRLASLLGVTLLLSQLAPATSVGVGEHQCPICDRELKTTEVMSYSQFGEPARDLSDLPRYTLFGSPKACPWDLYSAFPGDWEMENPKERQAMKAFLAKKPLKIQLTPAESKILGSGDLPELLRSLLWTRTCNQQRQSDHQRKRFTTLLCFYGTKHATDPVLKQWNQHYRSEAIGLLSSHATDGSFSPVERSGFAYLAGELLRQAGQSDDAKKKFSQAQELASKSKSKDDEWVGRWAHEQTLRIEIEAIKSATLESWVMQPIPNPWWDSEFVEDLDPKKWNQHEQALDTLLARAASKHDTEAENILWKLVAKDPANLLAIAETSSEPKIGDMAGQTERWKTWFEEINQAVESESSAPLTKLLENGRNQNILGRICGFQQAPWQDDPKVKAAAFTACQSDDPTAAATRLQALDQREVLGELMDLLEEEDTLSSNAARLAAMLLKKLPEDPKLANYPVSYLLADLCADRPRFSATLQAALDGEWQSPFWKACIEYASGREDARNKLLKSPLRTQRSREDGMVFDHLLYQMFTETADKALVPDGLAMLTSEEWLPDEVQNYLMNIADDRVEPAMIKRLKWLNEPETKKHEAYSMILEFEALSIEENLLTKKLRSLDVK